MMGRDIHKIIATLPEDHQQEVAARADELKQEIEGLQELRKLAGKAQDEVADVLKIKQPSVSKIEKQADMYLSTLRSYVEAIGGKLELTVRLPSRPPIIIQHLGDIARSSTEKAARRGGTK
ncbi:Antitoxin HigA [Roseovarius sp. THAF9]|uniref:XRE family transcriptional regulator n=1 Tax=Roseovarius sp. THAF9 TaxID=2587847 RepID=UPI0012A8C3B7|nr:XRE family transcriptional regulator [Roseovarius sp. THAF9]QFT95089.1 Antitoxin HigA [Roseovarius sp. THAF9]